MVKIGSLIAGICCIGALYFIPIYQTSMPLFGTYSLTISSVASWCGNPMISALGGSSCSFYTGIFYLGWIIGIGLIWNGLFR